MNNKEFTSELADRLGYTIKDTSELISSLLSDMTQELEDGNVIAIQGFGSFEVKKKGGTYFDQSVHQAAHAGSSQTGIVIQTQ